MKLHRIYAIILRHMLFFKHSFDRLSDVFYWPVIDLFIWGLTMSYVKLRAPDSPHLIDMIIFGVLLWIIVWRAQYEVTVGLLEELWNKNLVNLFVAPLRFSEWIIALMIMGIMKAGISFLFASILAILFFGTNIYQLGWNLLLFIPLLLCTGWWVGFFVASIIMRFGTKIQTLAWTTIFVFAPFSAVFYPVSILPNWAQIIAHAFPTTYVFENMRLLLTTGTVNGQQLLLSLGLNVIYLSIASFIIRKSFKKVLQTGLAKVY